MKRLLIAATAALMIAPVTLAQANTFIRFEMIQYEMDAEPTEVKLRIPLSLVAAFGTQIDEAISQVEMESQEIDFRAIWAEVRAAGPNEYVTVNSEDTQLQIATTDYHVTVDATDDKGHMVKAKIPLALGDLLFGSPMDTQTLIDTLATFTDQDLLTVEGDRIEARAWIEIQ
jgi:hypothetical protein